MPNVCKWFVFDAIEYGVVVVPRGCPSTNAVKVNESVKFSVCVCVCLTLNFKKKQNQKRSNA